MRKMRHPYLRGTIWFAGAALCLVSLLGAPLFQSLLPLDNGYTFQMSATKDTLETLGLGNKLDKEAMADLIRYQRITGKSLAQVLAEPGWASKLGFSTERFKATWYISNPYDLLPTDLQLAIRNKPTPFKTREQVWDWCKTKKASANWKKALKAALVETTPHNLWRAARGGKPYAKNGEFLKPIVFERPGGAYDVDEGHIATDPRYIPTNTEVLLLVRIGGKDRILKVKATDIGGGVKGKHVDLPIHLDSRKRGYLPNVLLPKQQISNPSVRILIPHSLKTNPNQKA